jgi:hypothetical protein
MSNTFNVPQTILIALDKSAISKKKINDVLYSYKNPTENLNNDLYERLNIDVHDYKDILVKQKNGCLTESLEMSALWDIGLTLSLIEFNKDQKEMEVPSELLCNICKCIARDTNADKDMLQKLIYEKQDRGDTLYQKATLIKQHYDVEAILSAEQPIHISVAISLLQCSELTMTVVLIICDDIRLMDVNDIVKMSPRIFLTLCELANK